MKLEISAYQNLALKIRHTAKIISTDILVREFGEVRHPGISDLDLVITGPGDQLRTLHHAILQIMREDSVARYILFHPPLYVPENVLSAAPFIHTLRGLQGAQAEGNVERIGDKSVTHELLHLVWFLFLKSIVVSQELFGARKTLLLSKNIAEAESHFGDERAFERIDEERALATQGIFMPKSALVSRMLALQMPFENRASQYVDAQSSPRILRAGKRLLVASTRWQPLDGLIVRVISPVDLALLAALADGNAQSMEVTTYRESYSRASAELARYQLPNGFVRPFGIRIRI